MRDLKKIKEEIKDMATMDLDTAMSCFYVLMDNGKPYTGISVRFSELVAYCWGGLEIGTRIISNDGKNIVVGAELLDKEKDSKYSLELTRSVVGINGRPISGEKLVNISTTLSSIAYRNIVFKAIPSMVLKKVTEEIQEFIKDNISDSTAMKDCIDFFVSKNVSKNKIASKLGLDSLSDIDSEKAFRLIGMKNAVESNDTTVHELFGKDKGVFETDDSLEIPEFNYKK